MTVLLERDAVILTVPKMTGIYEEATSVKNKLRPTRAEKFREV